MLQKKIRLLVVKGELYVMKEFLRFCIVGFVTFLADYGLLFVLTEFFNIKYLLSSGIAFSFAVILNYFLCLVFVFRDSRNGNKQFVLFIITSCIGLLLNQICMWMLVELAVIHYMLAKIISTAIVMMWNYFTKKKALQ